MNMISLKKTLFVALMGLSAFSWAIDPVTEGALHYDRSMANYGYNDEMRRNGGYNSGGYSSSNGGYSGGYVRDNWGAIARRLSDGEVFFVEYQPSEFAAEQAVLAQCGSNCEIVSTYHNGYIALAEGQNRQGLYGAITEFGTSTVGLKAKVLAECRRRGLFNCTFLTFRKSM